MKIDEPHVPLEWLVEPHLGRAEVIYARATALLEKMGQCGIQGGWFAEVGTFDGAFARMILRNTPYPLQWECVDTWLEPDPCSEYAKSGDSTAKVGQKMLDRAMAMTMENIGPYVALGRAAITPVDSVIAARSSYFGKYAGAFIDADHSEYGVARDLRAWWPVIRPDGLLSGHDWDLFGVTPAIRAWMLEIGMEARRLEFGKDSTWFLRKP